MICLFEIYYDTFNEVRIFRNQREEVIDSPVPIRGYRREVYDPNLGERVFEVRFKPTQSHRVEDVCLFKGKIFDFQPNPEQITSYLLVEDIQTDHPQAYFIKVDGTKRSLRVKWIDEDLIETEVDSGMAKVMIYGLDFDPTYAEDDWSGSSTSPTIEDNRERVYIYENEMREFINSQQSVCRGSTFLDPNNKLYFDKIDGLFYTFFTLRTQPSAVPEKNNVLFFREKAIDYPSDTFVVEEVQTEHPQAFYVEADGSKRELLMRII